MLCPALFHTPPCPAQVVLPDGEQVRVDGTSSSPSSSSAAGTIIDVDFKEIK